MRLNRGGYLIREGFRSIGTHGFMSFATVTIIMACLIIMGSVSLLSVNIDALIADLEDQNEMVVYVDETVCPTEEAAHALESSLLAVDNVSYVEFVTRGDAWDNFLSNQEVGFDEYLDETVLRHRFVIHLVDIALMAQTKYDLEHTTGVGKVLAHLEYSDAFVTIRNVVSVISLILIVMLVFVSFFIMSNTIKLATFGRREEIAIMKMVGATNSFIRLPFIIEGLVLGILGGSLAFVAEWGIYELVTGRLVSSFAGSFVNFVPFSDVMLPLFVFYMGTSVLVGVFGGVNAIKNYLKV